MFFVMFQGDVMSKFLVCETDVGTFLVILTFFGIFCGTTNGRGLQS